MTSSFEFQVSSCLMKLETETNEIVTFSDIAKRICSTLKLET